MKSIALVLVALFVGTVELCAQPMLLLSTQLENTNGAPVDVAYMAYGGGAVLTFTGTTDVNGYHEVYLGLPFAFGAPIEVLGQFTDCTGAIVLDSLEVGPLNGSEVNWAATWTANFCGEQGGGGGGGEGGCEVSFEVAQTTDAIGNPVPSSVDVWMGSAGETGAYTALWDFGDEGTSTELYPTHVYAGSGPYVLCLTATFSDPAGSICTATYCDTLALDAEGWLGLQAGFTLNVLPGAPSVGVTTAPAAPSSALVFPNPAVPGSDVRWAWPVAGERPVRVTLTDAAGTQVRSFVHRHASGLLSTAGLERGAYVLTLEQAGQVSRTRLVVAE